MFFVLKQPLLFYTKVMSEKEKNIDNFRLIIRAELSEKGIIPPVENSDEEKRLYEQWLKGFDRLEN